MGASHQAPLSPKLLEQLTHEPTLRPYLKNWSSTYNLTPSLLFHPVSTRELSLILSEAHKRGKHVRAVGEHHSPGPIWHSDQWLISMRHFKQVQINQKHRTARLGAGLTLREANPLLAEFGLSFTVIGSLPDVSIGAFFSGPDHGSSAFHSLCPNMALSAKIVLPTGEVVEAKKGEELYRAAGGGVGGVGVVTEVEWQLDEAFGLEVEMERVRLEDYLKDKSGRSLWELARSREFVKMWYFPHPTLPMTGGANTVLWRGRRVAMPPAQQPSLFSNFTALLFRVFHGLLILFTLYLFPRAQQFVNGLLFWMQGASLPATTVGRSYEMQAMDCLYNQLANEWTIPLPAPTACSTRSSAAPKSPAIELLRSLVTYFDSPTGRDLGMHAPFEIRFNRCDEEGKEFYLSPTAPIRRPQGDATAEQKKDDLVVWLEPIIYRPLNLPTPSRFYASNQFWESLLRTATPGFTSGRPHWCKAHFPTSPAESARMFPEGNVEAFHRIRKGVDPKGIMWSEWLEGRVPTPPSLVSAEERKGRESTSWESEKEAKAARKWEDVMGSRK
ncbi:hypothetical protein JCM11641_007938 [Rhodosporidiobolus odoratus]